MPNFSANIFHFIVLTITRFKKKCASHLFHKPTLNVKITVAPHGKDTESETVIKN